MSIPTTVDVRELEFFANDLDVGRIASVYQEHGCFVVRGLMKSYIEEIHRDIEALAAETLTQLDRAKKVPEGWLTPNGTLLIPAPENYTRDKQIMVLSLTYRSSAAFFRSAFDETTVTILKAVVGPNVELFMDGQCLYKEPVGGHPKLLHQDAAYFEHRYEGPVASLNYVVPTNLENGALYVVPGSHRLGMLNHMDTISHLGLDGKEWTWERAVPITGNPGDAIFFHVKTVHGSQQNHSKSPRPVFIHRYRRADDYVVVDATTTENRAQAIKHVGEATKENQMGFMVCGFRHPKQF